MLIRQITGHIGKPAIQDKVRLTITGIESIEPHLVLVKAEQACPDPEREGEKLGVDDQGLYLQRAGIEQLVIAAGHSVALPPLQRKIGFDQPFHIIALYREYPVDLADIKRSP